MNYKFVKLGKGMRIIQHKGQPIGTLEFTKGKWLLSSGVKQAKICVNADSRFYLGRMV